MPGRDERSKNQNRAERGEEARLVGRGHALVILWPIFAACIGHLLVRKRELHELCGGAQAYLSERGEVAFCFPHEEAGCAKTEKAVTKQTQRSRPFSQVSQFCAENRSLSLWLSPLFNAVFVCTCRPAFLATISISLFVTALVLCTRPSLFIAVSDALFPWCS